METAHRTDQPLCGRASERRFRKWFALITLAVCLVSISLAWQDRSWGALYIAFVGCPVANFGLMVLGTVAAFVIKRHNSEMKLGAMLSTVLSLPPLGALAAFIATFMMPLHGC